MEYYFMALAIGKQSVNILVEERQQIIVNRDIIVFILQMTYMDFKILLMMEALY